MEKVITLVSTVFEMMLKDVDIQSINIDQQGGCGVTLEVQRQVPCPGNTLRRDLERGKNKLKFLLKTSEKLVELTISWTGRRLLTSSKLAHQYALQSINISTNGNQ